MGNGEGSRTTIYVVVVMDNLLILSDANMYNPLNCRINGRIRSLRLSVWRPISIVHFLCASLKLICSLFHFALYLSRRTFVPTLLT